MLSFIIGNLAYVVTTAALVVRDMLWLRVLAAIANAGFVTANLLGKGGPNYAFLAWSIIFLVINLVQITRLILERSKIGLSPEDEDLHAAVFPTLQLGEFRVLLKRGVRRDLPPNTILVEQDQDSDDVLLIERGQIFLERNGQICDQLGAGEMLGEIAFVAKRPFSSRATVKSSTRVVAWDRESLTRLFLRRPSIAIGFHAAFIGQLRRNGSVSKSQ